MAQTWSELFDHLLSDSRQLLKTEVELLKVNAREGVRRETRTLRAVAMGSALGIVGALWLLLGFTNWIRGQFHVSAAKAFGWVGLGLSIIGLLIVKGSRRPEKGTHVEPREQ